MNGDAAKVMKNMISNIESKTKKDNKVPKKIRTGKRKIVKWEEFEYQVVEVTLLSKEEYMEYRSGIPVLEHWWWLRSPGADARFETCVYPINELYKHGQFVEDAYVHVRPALKIKVTNPKTFTYIKCIKLLGMDWTVLDIFDDVIYLLCDESLGCHVFDSNSNKWETSELKSWLEEEFNTKYLV